MSHTTHIMLVSGQPTPNLTPAIDPDLKPDSVILLVSPDMRERAHWLEDIYRPRGIRVEHWPIDNAWDIEHIQLRVMELLEREQAAVAGKTIILNATGGTKPMSIAAYESFRAYELPVYYVHPESDQLIWLYPEDRPSHQLADRIRLPDFIRAHGARVTERGQSQVPVQYQELAQKLIDDVAYFSNALGVLNWYANSAEKTLRSDPLESNHIGFDALQDLLDQLEQIGILTVQDDRLRFKDEPARFFANGGWLEQYIFAKVNSLKKTLPTIQDTAQSLQIVRGTGTSKNELDVVILANNRLHLIECKAKTFKKGDANSGTETLYKLDSLADTIGGLQARAMLVSYKTLSDHDAQRGRDLRIKVLQGQQLQQLDTQLRDWLG